MSWLPKKKVVVPVDFSDESFTALETALALVEAPSAIHLVHVLEEISVAEIGEMWLVVDEDTRKRHVEQALHERLKDPKFAGVQIHIGAGDPGSEIASIAQKLGAELIVLPSHGRTGISRLLIGSVAERVVRLAHCPVLVLRK
jgi:nucleotide-binding universal stress UspA family protein